MKKIITILLILISFGVRAQAQPKGGARLQCDEPAVQANGSSQLTIGNFDPGYQGSVSGVHADYLISGTKNTVVYWNCSISTQTGWTNSYSYWGSADGTHWASISGSSGHFTLNRQGYYYFRVTVDNVKIVPGTPLCPYSWGASFSASYE